MKRLIITLDNIQPISVNNQYSINTKTKTKFKSAKYNTFTLLVNNRLNKIRSQMKEFSESFDKKTHIINGKYTYHFPRNKIMNLDGSIKARRWDIDNLFKSLNDVIFSRMPIIDDSYIFNLYGTKVVSKDDDFHIEIELYLESLDNHLERII